MRQSRRAAADCCCEGEGNVGHGITLVDVGKQVPTCLAAIGDNFHVYVSIE